MDFSEAGHLTSIRRAVREICADFDDRYWRDHGSRHEFPREFYEVSISPIDKIGRNAVGSCEVRYDGLRLPASDRVGEEGAGSRYLLAPAPQEMVLNYVSEHVLHLPRSY